MPASAIFASHTPLKDFCSPGDEIEAAVDEALSALRTGVAAFNPDLVVAIGPDHFNGFFYRAMPGFCVGTEAMSVGDWNTPGGPLPVDARVAADLVDALMKADIDPAISHRMDLDHGFTQLLTQVFDWAQLPPVVPIFINCAAPPRPPVRRVVQFGRVLGEFLKAYTGRVLVTASGGLSHDPPVPSLDSAPPPVRERLIAGGSWTADERAARQERVLAEARKQGDGVSDRRELNPEWDQQIIEHLVNHDFDTLQQMTDDAITANGGCGGHEIRTWIMAAAAAEALGIASYEVLHYRAIPEWVAGYGIMRTM